MGLFDFLKKSPAAPAAVTFPADIGAVANGRFVAQEELPDELFSTGVLGPCCGVDPSEGKIYAPIGGTVGAVNRLVRQFGPKAVYDNFIIELPVLHGRDHIPYGTPVTTLLSLDGA